MTRCRRGLLAALFAFLATIAVQGLHAETSLVVGSKNFAESRLLAEIFAQLLEDRTGIEVERRLNLAGTQVAFEALRTGAIDLYPEYTGTGLVSLLREEASADSAYTLHRVRQVFRERWNLWWMAPLGFENAYEIAVRGPLAREYDLQSISDLVGHAPQLNAAFGFEFLERPDGLPGLRSAYGIDFASASPMQQALKYESADLGRVDVLDVYTTDGRLLSYDLKVLDDDRSFFPAYEAAPLIRGEVVAEHPEVGVALHLLAGAFDADRMRQLNHELQESGREARTVAREALVGLGLLEAEGPVEDRRANSSSPEPRSLVRFLWSHRTELLRHTLEHLRLTAIALLAGIATALPLGLLLERTPAAELILRGLGVTQTIPSVALLAFMIPLLGIGPLPAIVALWIYSLFPIVRATLTGLREADPPAVQAATALGMTPRQTLLRIRLPLAAPIILAGIRTAAVLTVGTATLAAFIGAGGLGEPIVTGLQLADTQRVLSGALPAALLAIAVDFLLSRVESWVRPPHLRADRQSQP